MTGFRFPRVYPILDSSMIPAEGRATFLVRLGRELADAGVGLMEYRNKDGAVEEILADAGGLRAAMPEAKLILDDRAELVERVGFDGVHVDDGDMTPAEARLLLGPERIIGTFAGNMELIPGVLSQPADYFAVGPVFRTITKKTSLPSIGTEGVRHPPRERRGGARGRGEHGGRCGGDLPEAGPGGRVPAVDGAARLSKPSRKTIHARVRYNSSK